MNSVIRKAQLQDLTHLARLFDLYRQFYGQETDLAGAENFIKERILQKDSLILVSEIQEDKTFAGFAQLYPSWSSIGMKKTWILNDLYVDSSFRSHGTGEALVLKAMEIARNSGARSLSLQTARTNTKAQKLYERLGWKKDEKFLTYSVRLEGVD